MDDRLRHQPVSMDAGEVPLAQKAPRLAMKPVHEQRDQPPAHRLLAEPLECRAWMAQRLPLLRSVGIAADFDFCEGSRIDAGAAGSEYTNLEMAAESDSEINHKPWLGVALVVGQRRCCNKQFWLQVLVHRPLQAFPHVQGPVTHIANWHKYVFGHPPNSVQRQKKTCHNGECAVALPRLNHEHKIHLDRDRTPFTRKYSCAQSAKV